jgi:hypothetical protein
MAVLYRIKGTFSTPPRVSFWGTRQFRAKYFGIIAVDFI